MLGGALNAPPSQDRVKSLKVAQVQGCVGDGVCVMLCDDAVCDVVCDVVCNVAC